MVVRDFFDKLGFWEIETPMLAKSTPEGARDFAMLKRTHNCGRLRFHDAGKEVTLAGWVHSYRDHGNLVFIDLRDREGLTQIVFDPETQPAAHKLAKTARCEWVIAATGVVQPRSEGMENPKLPTGQIEVAVEQMEILNTSKTPPFEFDMAEKTNEEIRLATALATVLQWSCGIFSISWASGRLKRRCWPRALRKEREISLCPADFTRTVSTHCPSRRSSSSKF
jgi:aspartyl-tRNA synthetase